MGTDGLGCFDANSLEGLVYRSDPSISSCQMGQAAISQCISVKNQPDTLHGTDCHAGRIQRNFGDRPHATIQSSFNVTEDAAIR
jgi:hypothetical protein